MVRTLVDDCFRPNQPRLTHGEALALLRQAATTLTNPGAKLATPDDVYIDLASGRILAQDVSATAPVPAHINSAVDGYAFAHAEYKAPKRNVLLTRVGRSAAGHPYAGVVAPGQTIRIFTGATLPAGADTVAMQEDVELLGETETSVLLPAGLKRGANVRNAGEDVAPGTVLFQSGHLLRPQDLAALASIGRSDVACYKPVRVAIASTGDEVRVVGSGALTSGQVYDANTPMLAALCALTGAQVTQVGIWPDTLDSVAANLTAAAKRHDVILTSGGASLGEEDHMARALGEIGQRHLWQIAVKPGRPMMFGQIRSASSDSIVIGLPGNPVAVFVCFLMYVYPLLRALGGAPWREPTRFQLPADFAFSGRKAGRREFWRGRLRQGSDGMVVEKFDRDGSGLISGLRWSGGLIDIPEDCGDVARGDLVAFIPYTEFGIV